MAHNVITSVFKDESEAKLVLKELEKNAFAKDIVISQAVLVKKDGEKIETLNSFDTGAETENDTVTGGMIGALIGIIGGPLGMLLAGGVGAAIGASIDAKDAINNMSIMDRVSIQLMNGETAIIILAEENSNDTIDGILNKYQSSTAREDAAVVAAEVMKAQEVQGQLQAEVYQKMIVDRKAEAKEKIEEKRAEIKERFEKLKKKLNGEEEGETVKAETKELTAEEFAEKEMLAKEKYPAYWSSNVGRKQRIATFQKLTGLGDDKEQIEDYIKNNRQAFNAVCLNICDNPDRLKAELLGQSWNGFEMSDEEWKKFIAEM